MTNPYTSTSDKAELLRCAREVAQQKGLDLESVFAAMAEAVQLALRKNYGSDSVKVEIDSKTAEIFTYVEVFVVDPTWNSSRIIEEQGDRKDLKVIPITEARLCDPNVKPGQIVKKPIMLPKKTLSPNALSLAKNKISVIIKAAERKKQYDEFAERARVSDLAYGAVKRIEHNGLVVDINGNEAFLANSQLIAGETFRPGDRIKACVHKVVSADNSYAHQIFLSRASKEFVRRVLEQEVPEIQDGSVQIKAIAREVGAKVKVGVYSSNDNLDPVGACIGIRGNRINAVMRELNNEKVDVFEYSANLSTCITNAMHFVNIVKIIIDEAESKVEIIVPEGQVSLAIGRRGQNIRLVSELIGWKIEILSDSEEMKRRNDDFSSKTKLFMDALDVEEIIAQLLAIEGFTTIDELSVASIEELIAVEGFNEDIAVAIQERANEHLCKVKEGRIKSLKDGGMSESLVDSDLFSLDELEILKKNQLDNFECIADLAYYELVEIIPSFSEERSSDVILRARKEVGLI